MPGFFTAVAGAPLFIATPSPRAQTDEVKELTDRASKLMARGDCLEAARLWSQVIRLEPRNKLAYNERGYCRATSGKLEDALDDYDEALRIDPKYGMPPLNRGLHLHAA